MKNKKILVIDDDKDIGEALQIILEEGYIVSTIFKGDETYKVVREFKPNIILLDVLMSGNDGRIICRKLKTDRSAQEILIVMMSAHPSAAKEYLQCGGNGFLAKPFETEELMTIIRTTIN